MNFFIDECLSDALTQLAIDRGYWGSASVRRRSLFGIKDWKLLSVLLDGDFTFVTRNAIDFRGDQSNPGVKGLYGRVALHAGLICLNGPDSMDLEMQLELFGVALDKLVSMGGDLTNQALEVNLNGDGDFVVRVYDLPKP